MNSRPAIFPISLRAVLALVALALLIQSCAFPGQPALPALPADTPAAGLQTPTALPTGSVEPTAATPLPESEESSAPAETGPQVISTQPPALGEWLAGQALVIGFNQPMDRASVEAALQIQPKVEGRVSWNDSFKLRFLPAALPAPGTKITVSLAAGVKAQDGSALARPWQVELTTPPFVRITTRLPAPDSADSGSSSPVVVAFNHPIVDLSTGSSKPPAAFTFDPALNGRGVWISPSTYLFQPQAALPVGAKITARFNPDVLQQTGLSLDPGETTEWSFTVAAPKLLSLTPDLSAPLPPDAVLQLAFSQPMDPPSVESNFSLTDAKGVAVEGRFDWDATGDQLSFTPKEPLKRSGKYTLLLMAGASAPGGAAIGSDLIQKFSVLPPLTVTGTEPRMMGVADIHDGQAQASLSFSAPLKPGQDWAALAQLDPPIDDPSYALSADGTTLTISGIFTPVKKYGLTLSPDLLDRWGGALGNPFYTSFSTSIEPPLLAVPALERARNSAVPVVFIPSEEIELPARLINVMRLAMVRGDLTLADFIRASADPQWLLQGLAERPKSEWVKLVYARPNVTENTAIPLSIYGGSPNPGLYFFKVDPTGLDGNPVNQSGAPVPPALFLVSSYQTVVKASANQAFVWLARLDNQPVPGALVTFYDRSLNPLGECATGPDGACQVLLPPGAGLNSPVYAVTGQPGSPDFSLGATNWKQNPSEPDPPANKPLKMMIYTDRPAYLPGEVINFRVAARTEQEGAYNASGLSDIHVNLEQVDPQTHKSQVIVSVSVPLSAFGAGAAQVTLPADLPPGTYFIDPDGAPGSGAAFTVVSASKPDETVQAAFLGADQLYGSDLAAGVAVKDLSGTVLPGKTVSWSLYARLDAPALPAGMASGPLDLTDWNSARPGAESRLLLSGETTTGADGSAAINFTGAQVSALLPKGPAYRLTLVARAPDDAGGWIEARAEMRLFPAQMVIGVRPEDWLGQAGSAVVALVRTLGWSGAAVQSQALSARFQKIIWNRLPGRDGVVKYAPELLDAGSTDFFTSEKGEARIGFTPDSPGVYLLEVSGNGALTDTLLWVGGEGSAAWPELPGQVLALRRDAASYLPGQTAKLFIPNPFGAPATALVTVERGSVTRWQVVSVTGSSAVLDLPVQEADAPGVIVAVTLLGREGNELSFRAGSVDLPVQPSAETLRVKIEAKPQNPQPGDELTLRITASDSSGQPAQAEFSVALVDPASAVQPFSLVNALYGGDTPTPLTGSSPAVFAERITVWQAARPPAPAGSSLPLPAAESNGATAYWNGSVVTGADGAAVVTLKLPAAAATWAVVAQGITAGAQVGEARFQVAVEPLVSLRPLTPAHAVVGDRMQLSALVENHTSDSLTARVALQADGFRMDNKASAAQVVEIPANQDQTVTWSGVVADVPSIDMAFSATVGDLVVTASPPGGALPVSKQQSASPGVVGGLSIYRTYALVDNNCRSLLCAPNLTQDFDSNSTIQVTLALSVAQEGSDVTIEDFLPAGAELLNVAPAPGPDIFGRKYFTLQAAPPGRLRWTAKSLPAGTYVLAYRLRPVLNGEFHALGARAWLSAYPGAEASSGMDDLTIKAPG